MSRLIVKGLPVRCTEGELRDHFAEFGTITDCALKYTKEGKFRRFAFVGFEGDENAKKACIQIHGTFLGTSRLMVEHCKPFGDSSKPRAWSKYAKDSSAYKRAHPEKKTSENENSEPLPPVKKCKGSDAKFMDFLDVQSVSSSQIPSTLLLDNRHVGGIENSLRMELLDGITGDTSLSVIVDGLPSSIKPKNLKDFLLPIRLRGVKFARDDQHALAFVSFFQHSDVKKALKKEGEFLGGYKLKIERLSEKTVDNETKLQFTHDTREEEVEAIAKSILETGRLFVRNLPYTCKDEDLYYLFKKFGEVSDLQNVISRKTGQTKGFAIVTYVFPECAVAAYSALDGTVFKGRMLHILPGHDKKEKLEEENEEGRSSFKKTKNVKMKQDAGKAHSWNTLFLGANAVAETLAEKLDVKKSDILMGGDQMSAGVRLALAETRLVRETRDYLLANGICLDVFSRPASKRCDKVIIVKNLPTKTEIDELIRMFERFGPVEKGLLPPGGITAIIEMKDSHSAKSAFSGLAYSRFRTTPLYLEWAPLEIFIEDAKMGTEVSEEGSSIKEEQKIEGKKEIEISAEEKSKLRRSKKHRLKDEQLSQSNIAPCIEVGEDPAGIDKVVNKEQVVKTENVQDKIGENANDADEEILEGTTVFVKNLSFNTTDEALKSKFASRFRIRSAKVSRKIDLKDQTKTISMGFGFVNFYSPDDAQTAIKEMQGTLLDGHVLELKLSHREVQKQKVVHRKGVDLLEQGDVTKILIRNIPFQAKRSEIRQLFSSFGEIRSIRMPKKVGASSESHRGFGFVDFLTRADARRAFESLVHSTHFYGRRLVLEWAKPDDNLEELREKTIAKMSGNQKEARMQKKLLRKIEEDLTVIDDD